MELSQGLPRRRSRQIIEMPVDRNNEKMLIHANRYRKASLAAKKRQQAAALQSAAEPRQMAQTSDEITYLSAYGAKPLNWIGINLKV